MTETNYGLPTDEQIHKSCKDIYWNGSLNTPVVGEMCEASKWMRSEAEKVIPKVAIEFAVWCAQNRWESQNGKIFGQVIAGNFNGIKKGEELFEIFLKQRTA